MLGRVFLKRNQCFDKPCSLHLQGRRKKWKQQVMRGLEIYKCISVYAHVIISKNTVRVVHYCVHKPSAGARLERSKSCSYSPTLLVEYPLYYCFPI